MSAMQSVKDVNFNSIVNLMNVIKYYNNNILGSFAGWLHGFGVL